MDDDRYIYSTKEITKFYGLTAKGLAYYEEQGIISPVRKKDSTYRMYTLDDCYSLYQSKLFKNCGFTLKEMVQAESELKAEDTISDIGVKLREERKSLQIQEMALYHLENIAELLKEYCEKGAEYTIEERPAMDRLFVRTYSRHESNDAESKEFEIWNSYIPIVNASLLISKDRLNSDEINVDIGNICSHDDFLFLGLKESERVVHYAPCRCVRTIICGKSKDINKGIWLKEPMKYISDNGYKLCGDIITRMLLKAGKDTDGDSLRYDVAWFPVK